MSCCAASQSLLLFQTAYGGEDLKHRKGYLYFGEKYINVALHETPVNELLPHYCEQPMLVSCNSTKDPLIGVQLSKKGLDIVHNAVDQHSKISDGASGFNLEDETRNSILKEK